MATDVPMDAGPRRTRLRRVLAVLAVGLVAVTAYQVWPARPVPVVPVSRSRPPAGGQLGMGDAPPVVRLDALRAEGPQVTASSRNPFRFQPRSASVPVQPVTASSRPLPPTFSGAGGSAGEGAAGSGSGQAAPPPITLKFIGTIEGQGVGKIAALSDGKFVFHGREGDVIEGRYRIVKIGVESIILEHVDGRGRQTIRLTG